MADKKSTNIEWLLIHGGVYSLCIAAILIIGAGFSRYWLFLVLSAGISHFAIDCLKMGMPASIMKRIPDCVKNHAIFKKKFIIDQLLHIVTLIALWWLWGECIPVREHAALRGFLNETSHTLADFMLVILGLLVIIKPVGLLIGKGDIWDFNKSKSGSAPNESQKGAGKMIGYLERIIVFFLLINNQFGAIAFVLAAKSVMRFPEIGRSDDASSLAEYYIIGTLLSMTSVFAVAFLLGLI